MPPSLGRGGELPFTNPHWTLVDFKWQPFKKGQKTPLGCRGQGVGPKMGCIQLKGMGTELIQVGQRLLGGFTLSLRVDSPFFPTIVFFENRRCPWVAGGFLERRIPGKNGEGSTRHSDMEPLRHQKWGSPPQKKRANLGVQPLSGKWVVTMIGGATGVYPSCQAA